MANVTPYRIRKSRTFGDWWVEGPTWGRPADTWEEAMAIAEDMDGRCRGYSVASLLLAFADERNANG